LTELAESGRPIRSEPAVRECPLSGEPATPMVDQSRFSS
jgi:hypothetical protein